MGDLVRQKSEAIYLLIAISIFRSIVLLAVKSDNFEGETDGNCEYLTISHRVAQSAMREGEIDLLAISILCRIIRSLDEKEIRLLVGSSHKRGPK